MNLPRIIDIKHQKTEGGLPYELLLYEKINKDIVLNNNEKNDLIKLTDFYFTQIDFFEQTIPSSLQQNDFKNLEKHFRKVFDVSFLFLNDIHSNIFYRAVVNKEILKVNERINLIRHLSNPTTELIKEIGKYGRANTPENAVLYLSIDESNTMTEINYDLGDLITISTWRQNKGFKIQPIILDFNYHYQQDYINRTIQAYKILKTKYESIYNLMLRIHKFLSKEFSKNVKNHLDYLYSSNYVYSVFNTAVENNSSLIGFLYPSVGCDYKNFNLVFEPRLIGDNLSLINVKEIRIKEKFDFRKNNGLINKHDITGHVTAFSNGELIWHN